MSAEPSAVTLALRALGESELHVLTAATRRVPTTLAPGLIAWILAVLDWELQRRADHHGQLALPDVTIPVGEEAASLDAAMAMRATFARHSPTARALFDALVDLLAPRTSSKRSRKPFDDRTWLE